MDSWRWGDAPGILLGRLAANRHGGAVFETVEPAGRQKQSRSQSFHCGFLLIAGDYFDLPEGDGVIGLYDVNKRIRTVVLYARRWNQRRILQRSHQKARIDELIRKKGEPVVGECRAEF